jgi:predicted acyltransferase
MAMLLVNSPGHSGQLSHSKWIGVTFADVIFPCFLFMVGITLQLARQRGALPPRRIASRAATLFALGLLVNLIIAHFAYLRVAGVLQRIAIVYAVCALLPVRLGMRGMLGLGATLLLAYWDLMALVPAPGMAAGALEPGLNLAAWIDRQLLPGTLRRVTWDPEGLLSTLPAVATALLGMVSGSMLTASQPLPQRLRRLAMGGAAALALGLAWSPWFPPIKPLWTSSFVLITGGWSMLLLAALCWYTDMLGARRGTGVPAVFGANATVAYVLHEALATLFTCKVAGAAGAVSVWLLASGTMRAAGLSPAPTALLYSAAFIAVCYLPIRALYHRRIFIKV